MTAREGGCRCRCRPVRRPRIQDSSAPMRPRRRRSSALLRCRVGLLRPSTHRRRREVGPGDRSARCSRPDPRRVTTRAARRHFRPRPAVVMVRRASAAWGSRKRRAAAADGCRCIGVRVVLACRVEAEGDVAGCADGRGRGLQRGLRALVVAVRPLDSSVVGAAHARRAAQFTCQQGDCAVSGLGDAGHTRGGLGVLRRIDDERGHRLASISFAEAGLFSS